MTTRRIGTVTSRPRQEIRSAALPVHPSRDEDRGEIDIHCPECNAKVFEWMSLAYAAVGNPVQCDCGTWVSPQSSTPSAPT